MTLDCFSGPGLVVILDFMKNLRFSVPKFVEVREATRESTAHRITWSCGNQNKTVSNRWTFATRANISFRLMFHRGPWWLLSVIRVGCCLANPAWCDSESGCLDHSQIGRCRSSTLDTELGLRDHYSTCPGALLEYRYDWVGGLFTRSY